MVPQWFRAVAPQAEGWVFETQPQQTLVVKTGMSESFTAKRSALSVSPRVLGDDHYSPMSRVTVGVRGTLKNPHCPMALSVKHMSKFAALHRQL